MDLRGIDVSDYQGQVNWKAVADSGVGYAIAKSTEGATFVAETFARNWREIQAAGIVRGAYHFFRPQSDPVAQAQHFLNVVELETGDLPAVLDVERTDNVSPNSLLAGMKTWLDIVEEATQRRPIVYTYPGFWERLGNSLRFADYPLWIAHYTNDSEPWVTGGWDTWMLWQYTDRGSINGVVGPVDINRYNLPKVGQSGSDVKSIQRRLKATNFDPGIIDGIFGQNTKAAVEAFQAKASLTNSGEVDVRTWAYLMDAGAGIVGRSPLEGSDSDGAIEPDDFSDNSGSSDKPPTDEKAPEELPIFTPIIDGTPETDRDVSDRPESSKDIDTSSKPPVASVPEVATTLSLIDVTKYYQNLTHQIQALNWLQDQISDVTLLEFARRWRNVATTRDPIRLVNVARYYQGLASQNQALVWLQGELSNVTIAEFARRWREAEPDARPPLKLSDAAKYYQGMPQQQEAFEWLQQQLSPSEIDQFARIWRNQPR